jgi:hypothetical protein
MTLSFFNARLPSGNTADSPTPADSSPAIPLHRDGDSAGRVAAAAGNHPLYANIAPTAQRMAGWLTMGIQGNGQGGHAARAAP